MLENLYIRCQYKDKGCDGVVTLANLEKHEQNCPQLKLEQLEKEIEEIKKRSTRTGNQSITIKVLFFLCFVLFLTAFVIWI